MGLILLYFTSALLLSFLCSVLEAVLLSTPMSYISMRERQGNRTASLMRHYKNNVDRPVGAILSLNTVAHTIGSAGVGAESVKIFGEEYFGVISAVLTLLILVLSEIIPKTIGASYWRALAMPATKVIRGMIIVTYPLVVFSELVTRLFTGRGKAQTVSREEVAAMVDLGKEEGVFKELESKVLKKFLCLSGVTAREVMTPCSAVVFASGEMTLQEFKEARLGRYSRIPIYEGGDGRVKGYVLKKTVLEYLSEDRHDVRLSELSRPILLFSATDDVYFIWESLLAKREHIAAIVDDQSNIVGIVTMGDVLETMTGLEIMDEKDHGTGLPERKHNNCSRWSADGRRIAAATV